MIRASTMFSSRPMDANQLVFRVLMADSNDRWMGREQSTRMFQLATTNVLYQLEPAFKGFQIKLAIEQVLETFNKTQVNFKKNSL